MVQFIIFFIEIFPFEIPIILPVAFFNIISFNCGLMFWSGDVFRGRYIYGSVVCGSVCECVYFLARASVGTSLYVSLC